MKQLQTARMSRLIWVVLLSLLVFTMVFSLLALANVISLEPSSSTLSSGESFTIMVNVSADEPVKSFECSVLFSSSAFSVQSVSEGDFFGNYSTYFNDGTIDNTNGAVTKLYGLILGQGNVTGNGTLLTLNCQAKSPSSDVTSDLNLSRVGITNETMYLSVSIENTSLLVEADETSPPSSPPSGGGGGIPPEEESVEPSPPETPLSPVGPLEIIDGVEETFSISSWDRDGDTLRFMMDWGDEAMSDWSVYVASNMTVVFTHQWDDPGVYSIKTCAQDDTGLSSIWSEPMIVTVLPDPADIEQKTKNVTIQSEISEKNSTFEFFVSDLELMDELNYSFEWDFGDGTNGTGLNPDHQYTLPGNYTVTVTIIDKNGNSTVKTFTVTVSDTMKGSSNSLKENSEDGFVSWWILLGGILGAVIAGIIIFFRFFTIGYVDE